MADLHLLDTNIVSDLIRNPQGKVAARIADVGEAQIAVSIVTAAELRYGCLKRGSPRITQQVELILGAVPILPFDEPSDAAYARIRRDLEQAGTPIGPNDLLIAAHCLALGAVMVTANVREFSRVKGLMVENWLD
ncbi:type II toxin-antitoxin system VapC family toxin [Tistrella mobilis]|uniref:type II toxin-antitoxin system VapC family toxin n=1 Tax=Tistrella mobilis TaxID=171437 RepID=UPI0035573DF1